MFQVLYVFMRLMFCMPFFVCFMSCMICFVCFLILVVCLQLSMFYVFHTGLFTALVLCSFNYSCVSISYEHVVC